MTVILPLSIFVPRHAKTVGPFSVWSQRFCIRH